MLELPGLWQAPQTSRLATRFDSANRGRSLGGVGFGGGGVLGGGLVGSHLSVNLCVYLYHLSCLSISHRWCCIAGALSCPDKSNTRGGWRGVGGENCLGFFQRNPLRLGNEAIPKKTTRDGCPKGSFPLLRTGKTPSLSASVSHCFIWLVIGHLHVACLLVKWVPGYTLPKPTMPRAELRDPKNLYHGFRSFCPRSVSSP